MHRNSRRGFLADVGKGMLIGSVGPALAVDLGLAPVFADDDDSRLSFGALEPLVALMQETPPDKLQPRLVKKLKSGTDLRTMVAAAALANARTFGGQDYVGFHTIMASPGRKPAPSSLFNRVRRSSWRNNCNRSRREKMFNGTPALWAIRDVK